ncbi:MAG: hypothetical protein JWP97_2458 [Labilithrix sp.]|nr:hypothetical protein [Labilithrix sp.]
MAKFQSPLLGYNNNVRHKNRVFHIQTEDSGVNHPHIITHLFMDGGRILKSVKQSYAEHVGQEGMQEIVRGLMKEQHKAIFVALRDGQFDALLEAGTTQVKPGRTAGSAPASKSEPAAIPVPPASDPVIVPAPPSVPDLEAAAATHAAGIAPTVAALPAVSAAKAPPEEAEDDDAPTQQLTPITAAQAEAAIAVRAAPAPDLEETQPFSALAAASADGLAAGPPSSRGAPHVPVVRTMPPPPTIRDSGAPTSGTAGAPPPELTLDFHTLDALDRASHEPGATSAGPSIFQSSDLPPPPKNLFAKEPGTGGAYRAVEPVPVAPTETRGAPERSDRNDPREESDGAITQTPASRAVRPAAGRPATEGRYAPARPAAIFGATRRPPPASLFSDDLVSDKSLDEVILSYLAEDLEPPPRK